ncbi:MAG: hypothetical protein U9Q81_08875 [Pseudomonadota bacterium]|nr:hypothetical protein [Pseudomonadota bacterium]
MSKLLKVVYDVAGIRAEYLRVHDEVLGLSARNLIRVFHRSPADTRADKTRELRQLARRLLASRKDLTELSEDDLSIRRGREICNALDGYVDALAESVDILATISELRQRPIATDNTHDFDRLNALKVAYDDAVQYRKRLGTRLNKLISSL